MFLFRETIKIMEAITRTRNANVRKVSDKWSTNEGIDRISKLPDSILQHILTFLPTRDAVGTSILSKRWEQLWMSITSFVFCMPCELIYKRDLFMNFVGRVLMLRDSSDIKYFALACDVLCDASRINTWILYALQHNVRKLFLALCGLLDAHTFPPCLFNCDSLEDLTLEMSRSTQKMGRVLKLPRSVCFSSLKSLYLKYVTFEGDYSTKRLFSGCPVLENLTLALCKWENVEAVCISAPMLRNLTIYETENRDNCQKLIFGTSLQSFIYIGGLLSDYCFYDSTSLIKAYFDVGCGSFITERATRHRGDAYRANRLLRGFSHVKNLALTPYTLKVLTYAEEFIACLPVFPNLIHLEFHAEPMDFACGTLLRLLQNLPCLSSLAFAEGICLSTYCEKTDWRLAPVPPCFTTRLKTIKICNFCGTEGELHVVKNLLKDATTLEKMVISCSLVKFSVGSGRQKEVREQLLMLPRGSISCVIEIS